MFDLTRFSLSDGIRCGALLRAAGDSPHDGIGDQIVRTLYDAFVDATGQRQCALVRLYRTAPFAALDDDLQGFARDVAGDGIASDTACLTLLATAGEKAEWNEVGASQGHRTIPLPSEEVVLRSPMVAQLIRQFGVDLSAVVRPQPEIIVDLDQQQFNVFFVEDARGSEHVPAQDFVRSSAIRSVLGFGGMMPEGSLFAVILFTKVTMSRHSAEIFRTVALNIKLALLEEDSLTSRAEAD